MKFLGKRVLFYSIMSNLFLIFYSSRCRFSFIFWRYFFTCIGRFLIVLVIIVKNGKLFKCLWVVEEINKLWYFNIKKCYGLEIMIEL